MASNSFISRIGEDFSRRPVPYLIGGIVVIGASLYIIKKFGAKISQKATTLADEIKLSSEGQKLSYPLTTYKTLADALEQAGTAWFGTDEKAIYGVFEKMKNDLDIVQLFKAFGMRRLEFSFTQANLGGFLASELSADEIQNVNKILASKGIKYRF